MFHLLSLTVGSRKSCSVKNTSPSESLIVALLATILPATFWTLNNVSTIQAQTQTATSAIVADNDDSNDGLRPWLNHPEGTVRFATFNTAMNRDKEGQLLEELSTGSNEQAQQLAQIIQCVRPDVLLICEIDRDPEQKALDVFHDLYLAESQGELQPIEFAYRYFAESNTGIPSTVDFNNNGKSDEADDAFGFGQFPGKYAMAVLSKFPIEENSIRSYQKFLWTSMPNANWPVNPETKNAYYSPTAGKVFRLSSKSHWLLPIATAQGTIYFAAAHPTPPVFDGPEDRNGLRNHDEIRLLADALDESRGDYLVDDNGTRGGLPKNAKFIVAGDMNADPNDGDSSLNAIDQLLNHPLIDASHLPTSIGGQQTSQRQGKINLKHKGPAKADTSDFNDNRVGNLRLDYVLPSKTLKVISAGVFWPADSLPEHTLVQASDHRLVWIDVK